MVGKISSRATALKYVYAAAARDGAGRAPFQALATGATNTFSSAAIR